MLSDERLVDKNDDRSNEKLLRKYLIEKISLNNNPPMLLDIKEISNNENHISDFALLGLGVDGHTASLFPNKPEIFSLSGSLLKVKKSNEDFERFSLTFEFLLKSKYLAFLVLGKEKNEVLNEVINGNYNPVKYPTQYIFNNYSRDIEIFCDKEAFGDMKT